jgi:hypothetical protein
MTTTQPPPRCDLADLRTQVQQARADSSAAALGHYGSGELTAEAHANGRVEALDEVLGWLGEGNEA